MVGAEDESFVFDAGLPERGRGGCRGFRLPGAGAMFDGKFEAEAFEGDAAVVVLAASFGGGDGQAGGRVDEFDGGLGFVAVLSAGAGGLETADAALFEELFGIEGGGVPPEMFVFSIVGGGWWRGSGHGSMVSRMLNGKPGGWRWVG